MSIEGIAPFHVEQIGSDYEPGCFALIGPLGLVWNQSFARHPLEIKRD